MVFLKRWKRAKTQIKKLIKLGLDVDSAKCIGYSRIGYWRLAKTHEINKAMSNARLERNGFLFHKKFNDRDSDIRMSKNQVDNQ